MGTSLKLLNVKIEQMSFSDCKFKFEEKYVMLNSPDVFSRKYLRRAIRHWERHSGLREKFFLWDTSEQLWVTHGKTTVYNVALFVQASNWTAVQWMTDISVTFSCWPAVTCVSKKKKDHIKQRSHAKSYLLVKIVRRLHCSSIQPCFLPDSV